MDFLAVNNIFSGKLVAALCWMLVHSLWMGLALAVVTGIIILCTQKQTAALRYALFSTALLLFILGSGIVFIQQLFVTETATTPIVTKVTVSNTSSIGAADTAEITTGYTARAIIFFNSHATLIVGCWFLMIAFRCVVFAGGLYKIRQMKTTRLTDADDYWKQRMQELATELNIRGNIQLVQSGMATIPMVVGHLKPVILFPVGLLTSLPTEEVEAVLLHELAHIQRKDYIVNLLQHFAEILFFFNPAVLWVSALIKTERENCCDDIAVAKAGNKRCYINALVSFQEYHLNAPQYTTALTHHNKHLLQRVKRLLYNNNKTLNAMEKTFLTVCIAAATSLAVLFAQPTTAQTNDTIPLNSNNDTSSSIAKRHYSPADFNEGATIGFSEIINGTTHNLFVFKRKGVLYEIYDDMAIFKINGKVIPSSEYGQYKVLINQLKSDEQTSVYANNELQNKLKAEQLELLTQKDKLDAETQQLNNSDKIKAEQLELLSQKDKLNAEMQQLNNTGKLKAEQLELLSQKDKLNAEMQQLNNIDELKATQLELLVQQKKLKASTKQLQHTDKLKAEQLSLMAQQEKFNAERLQLKEEQEKFNAEQQELLLKADKVQEEKQQLLLMQDKLKAEAFAKDAAQQKEQAERNEKEKVLQLKIEERHQEINKQKIKAERKGKKAERQEKKAEAKEARDEQKQEQKDKEQNEKDRQQQGREDAEKEIRVDN